jgi:hypothetical protein
MTGKNADRPRMQWLDQGKRKTQKEGDNPGEGLKKYRNGQTEAAGDFFAKSTHESRNDIRKKRR